jgi:hypothetical protein
MYACICGNINANAIAIETVIAQIYAGWNKTNGLRIN